MGEYDEAMEGSGDSSGQIPECPHPDGHAWISGRVELTDDDLVEIVSRQCRRCGFEHELENDG